jgi:hypothetical protein
MNSLPIKDQIASRISDLLDELRAQDGINFRATGESSDLFAEANILPSCFFSVDGEAAGDVMEDNRGYNLSFIVTFKITVAQPEDKLNAEARRLAGIVQEKIESDLTLSALAKWIEYLGDDPFLHANLTTGGTLINYRVSYRRVRGGPDQTY